MYEYLIHSGIKGMKWGVRNDPKRSNNSHNNRRSNKQNKKNNSQNNLSNMLNDASGFVRAIDKYKKNKSEEEIHNDLLKETKNYTDKELKQMTNRLILENNYMMAKNNQNKTRNSSKVNDILDIVGTGVKMTGSAAITAASIITAINTIKKGIS